MYQEQILGKRVKDGAVLHLSKSPELVPCTLQASRGGPIPHLGTSGGSRPNVGFILLKLQAVGRAEAGPGLRSRPMKSGPEAQESAKLETGESHSVDFDLSIR